jgi:K+-transporting ATPase KdpF subunit
MSGAAISFEGGPMSFEILLGLVIALVMLAYLVYALVYPERF